MSASPIPVLADAGNATASVLDGAALARLRELDPDGRQGVVVRVLQTFEASLQRLLGQAAQARERGDLATVGAVAHTLKSSSASVGALALNRWCALVEAAVRQGEGAEVPSRLAAMLDEGNRVLATVRAMLRD
jgi:HPt (histidine-containing phosphotransfer) domain-containing protein